MQRLQLTRILLAIMWDKLIKKTTIMKVYELIARLQAMPPMVETEISFHQPTTLDKTGGYFTGVITEVTGKVDLFRGYYVVIKAETY